jgi:hypothetical protein
MFNVAHSHISSPKDTFTMTQFNKVCAQAWGETINN